MLKNSITNGKCHVRLFCTELVCFEKCVLTVLPSQLSEQREHLANYQYR